MRPSLLTPTITALIACTAFVLQAQVAPIAVAADLAPLPAIAYQGRLMEGAAAANGARSFTFSILDSAGAEHWNSGTLTLTVSEGLYSVVLGATGMPALPATLLGKAGLKLHVVLAGQAMTPDVDIIPAFQARSAWEVTGDFAGDVTGTQNQTLIMKLQGMPLDLTTTTPTNGQALVFNGSKWVASSVVGATGPMGPAGPQGPIGATGSIGATGPQGPIGLTGLIGPQGIQGPVGSNGLDGKTVLNGVGTPVTSGAAGIPGDFYLDTLNSILYGPKVGATWVGLTGVFLVGPQGPAGATGGTGTQGPIGPTGLTGPQGTQGPAGASPFTLNGSDAVYTAGSLGIGISPPDASALLDLTSTSKGFLPPRMTSVQRAAVVTPPAGLMVYQTDGTAGLYQFDGVTWAQVGAGSVTGVTGTAPITVTGTTAPIISLAKATSSVDGYLAAADFATFAGKGSGTVTSVAALTLGTTGTDLSSSVATGTSTPVITLHVPNASATNRGALSAADWATFNGKAPLASPTFTGTPAAPTATGGTNTTQIATTAFVTSAVTGTAPLASPTFTGTPAAPTATGGTNTTQIATTAFVTSAVAGKEPTLGNPGADGYVLSSTAAGARSWVAAGSGGGSTTIASDTGGNTAVGPTNLSSPTPDLAGGNSGRNTALGDGALTKGNSFDNTVVGYTAGSLLTGNWNTAIGSDAMYNPFGTPASGTQNTAVGISALWLVGSGSDNVSLGGQTGSGVQTGNGNVLIGTYADVNRPTYHWQTNSYTIPAPAATNRIAIGYGARAIQDNQMVIGGSGVQDPAIGMTFAPITQVIPGKDGTADLGSVSNQWADIWASGSVWAGYVALTSDGRLKTNQQPITSGLGTLMALRPKTYFKHRNHFANGALVLEDEGMDEAGFIAQELHEILPMAAHRPADESKGIWTVSYNQVIPYTVKAVQELKVENDALKGRVEALEAKLAALLAKLPQ